MTHDSGRPKQRLVVLRIIPGDGAHFKSGILPTDAWRRAEPAVEIVEDDLKHAPKLLRDGSVLAVAPELPVRLIEPMRCSPPVDDPPSSQSWGVEAIGAADSPFDGAGVTVAMLDTGVDADHDAFARGDLTVVTENFTSAPPGDEDGHGTHSAGILVGRSVGEARIGVAPGVKRLLMAKVLHEREGTSGKIADAILWAVGQDADVICMSLGFSVLSYLRGLERDGVPTAAALAQAVEAYRANLVLFDRLSAYVASRRPPEQPALLVAAAGNDSGRNASRAYEVGVCPPAVASGFVSVGAVAEKYPGKRRQEHCVAAFSNTGCTLVAPGENVRSAALSTAVRRNTLSMSSGTSTAAPHVAGVAALWIQRLRASKQLSADVLRAHLIASATRSTLDADIDPADVGVGLVQAPRR